MEPTIILGLSVNTRMLGLAVISGNRLLDYHIQLRKEPWTPRKREAILTSLQPWFRSYTITNIALSTSHDYQTSVQTKELLESITYYFSKEKIPLSMYPPHTLQMLLEEGKKKAKKEIMKQIASQYPELNYCYRKEMRNKNKYYIKLFEAVGVATIHEQIIERENKKAGLY